MALVPVLFLALGLRLDAVFYHILSGNFLAFLQQVHNSGGVGL